MHRTHFPRVGQVAIPGYSCPAGHFILGIIVQKDKISKENVSPGYLFCGQIFDDTGNDLKGLVTPDVQKVSFFLRIRILIKTFHGFH